MDDKIDCGSITHNGKIYKVEWESNTHLVWVVDEKSYRKNIGNAKANDKSAALDCAKEMLRISGL